MAGETDLARMLDTLDVTRRDGSFAFVVSDEPELVDRALATVDESEGRTLVVPFADAVSAGFEPDFEAAWLTLTVWSSLSAIGLTAAFSRALTDAGIPCNVLAGYHHDHVLVPVERADDAIDALRGLSSN